MSKNRNRARFAVLAWIAAIAVAAGCDRVKHELLEPQNPGLVDPSAVGSPTAALALRVGALGRYKQVQAGESIWFETAKFPAAAKERIPAAFSRSIGWT